ncbi:MAG: histidinol dehydrogenase [Nitrospirae bacterium]|nr:MAG: histidinol dehydrogenase [Nitrospirota bacterium]
MAETLRILDARDPAAVAELERVLARSTAEAPEVERAVAAIVAEVERDGDAALVRLTERFDGFTVAAASELEIGREEMAAAEAALDPELRRALNLAAERIRTFHERQREESWELTDAHGSRLGQLVRPLHRVAIYCPGGKAAYPSSVLMNAVPAKVAGVPEVVMLVPTPKGERNPVVLAAAHIAGVDRAFAIGGAQAVAAAAFGTETVPAADKVTGPGNIYVATAKKQLFGRIDIDMVAGPSEILIVADATADPDQVAIDLLSQAEHDELAAAVLVTPEPELVAAVAERLPRWLDRLSRREIAARSLRDYGALVRVADMEAACRLANRFAPEHLEVLAAEPRRWLPLLTDAGAIFLGPRSPEPLGDYLAGPNHVLPTGGSARFFSPLGVADFLKRTSLLEISEAGLAALGPATVRLAEEEGLTAHAEAVRLRLEGGR